MEISSIKMPPGGNFHMLGLGANHSLQKTSNSHAAVYLEYRTEHKLTIIRKLHKNEKSKTQSAKEAKSHSRFFLLHTPSNVSCNMNICTIFVLHKKMLYGESRRLFMAINRVSL